MNISSSRLAPVGANTVNRKPETRSELTTQIETPLPLDEVELSQAPEQSLTDLFKDQSFLTQTAVVGMGTYFVSTVATLGGAAVGIAGTVAGNPTATNIGFGVAEFAGMGIGLGAGLFLPAAVVSLVTGKIA